METITKELFWSNFMPLMKTNETLRTARCKVDLFLQIFKSFQIVYSFTYLFMSVQFDNFDPSNFSYFRAVLNLGYSGMLVVVMPIICGKLKLHDSLILVSVAAIESIGSIGLAFVTSPWVFYIIYACYVVSICKTPVVSGLLSKCFEPEEFGKVFAFQNFLTSLFQLGSDPALKKLYNFTLKSLPGN